MIGWALTHWEFYVSYLGIGYAASYQRFKWIGRTVPRKEAIVAKFTKAQKPQTNWPGFTDGDAYGEWSKALNATRITSSWEDGQKIQAALMVPFWPVVVPLVIAKTANDRSFVKAAAQVKADLDKELYGDTQRSLMKDDLKKFRTLRRTTPGIPDMQKGSYEHKLELLFGTEVEGAAQNISSTGQMPVEMEKRELLADQLLMSGAMKGLADELFQLSQKADETSRVAALEAAKSELHLDLDHYDKKPDEEREDQVFLRAHKMLEDAADDKPRMSKGVEY